MVATHGPSSSPSTSLKEQKHRVHGTSSTPVPQVLHHPKTGTASRVQLSLLALMAVANGFWLFLIVTRTDPEQITNRVWFLVALLLVTFPLATALIYRIRLPRVKGSAVRHCFSDALREGMLLGIFLTANALLRMTAFWSPLTSGMLLALVVSLDAIALVKQWPTTTTG